ncbi:MAG: TRAP transporter large permease subunit [Xanthobacteraceae bacterium]|nr:TRAP transporter large permease subunit [Xanthobacteraceae bacterium]PWB64767.1 MAG: C4-dicarboxylate ABC transporter [Bradyrhizobiaceae bacterium]
MSNEILGLFLLGSLLVGIFVGYPIAFTLIVLSVVFGYIGFGDTVFYLMVFQTIGLMKEETLAAVPLFIFMGHVLEQAGLMERLFRSFQLILAPVRGSLYLGVLLTATLFATATGIIGASVTVMGMMAAPAMMRAGYDPKLSAGTIAAGGTLGILIPPSVMLVVMGPVVGVSIIKLFAAAIIPGLLLAGLYIGYTMLRAFLDPKLGPPLPRDQWATSFGQIVVEFFSGIVPLAVIMFAALGSIIFGLATPTEAAAMGATGSLLLMIGYGRFTLSGVYQACLKTLETSSLVLFLAVASNIYGAVFTRLGTSTMIAEAMLGMDIGPTAMLILLMGVIFLLGWPLEWPAIIFIFLPIFLPVVEALKIDLLWFSTLVAVNLQTAFLSPPVAMAAYYLKAVAPKWELSWIYRGMFDFMLLQMVGLVLVFLFPAIALWLPTLLFGPG